MEIVTVSRNLLVDIVSSHTFKKALSKSGNKTCTTGHETGFTVMKKYASDDFGVPWVREGRCDAMWGGQPKDIQSVGRRRLRGVLVDAYPLFDVHFHPVYAQPVKPSLPDLHGIHNGFICEEYDGSRYEVRTIVGIAQVDVQGDVELLFIQPLMPFCPGEGEEGMFDQLVPATSTEEVAKLLTDSSTYIAEVVHFLQWELREADRERLTKFAFTPRSLG